MKHRAEMLDPTAAPGTGTGKHQHQSAPEAAEVGTPAHLIPASATWRSRRLGRRILATLTVLASVAVVPSAAYYWQLRTTQRLEVLIGVALLAVSLWAMLASRRTQQVSLRGSLLTVDGGRTSETFDLADGIQPVELVGDPRKGRWLLTLTRGDGSAVVLGRRDVDARQVDPIVRHFRDLAERRRAQRWTMLGL